MVPVQKIEVALKGTHPNAETEIGTKKGSPPPTPTPAGDYKTPLDQDCNRYSFKRYIPFSLFHNRSWWFVGREEG